METNANLIKCPYCGKMNFKESIKCTCGFFFIKPEYDKAAKEREIAEKTPTNEQNDSGFYASEKKVELKLFYNETQMRWKKGEATLLNPMSKKLAEAHTLTDFINLIDGITNNSLVFIDIKNGFFENEFLLYSIKDQLIVTNRRYFISQVNDGNKIFDYHFLEDIKSIKGIRQNTTLVFELRNKNVVYENFDESFIQDIVVVAPLILPSQIDAQNTSTYNYENRNKSNLSQKKYIAEKGKDSDKKNEAFPIAGVVIGSIGLLLLVLSLLPKDTAINTPLAIVILIIGAIIGANIQVYLGNKISDD